MEHTKGKIFLSDIHCDRGTQLIGSDKDYICEVYLYRSNEEMSLNESKANAKRLVKCWNMHDKLVEVCKEIEEGLVSTKYTEREMINMLRQIIAESERA